MHGAGSTDDHPVIPVTVQEAGEQVIPRCDFCFCDYPEYVLPVRNFVKGISGSMGDWAACETCIQLVEKNRWNALYDRTAAGYEARHGEMPPAVQTSMRSLHRTVRKNITGAPRVVGEWKP